MRRRAAVQDAPQVPVELARFVPGVWPSVEAWIAARQVWAGRNGWPGDPVDMIRQHADAKRRQVAGR